MDLGAPGDFLDAAYGPNIGNLESRFIPVNPQAAGFVAQFDGRSVTCEVVVVCILEQLQ
jgi:hypothetical protein